MLAYSILIERLIFLQLEKMPYCMSLVQVHVRKIIRTKPVFPRYAYLEVFEVTIIFFSLFFNRWKLVCILHVYHFHFYFYRKYGKNMGGFCCFWGYCNQVQDWSTIWKLFMLGKSYYVNWAAGISPTTMSSHTSPSSFCVTLMEYLFLLP